MLRCCHPDVASPELNTPCPTPNEAYSVFGNGTDLTAVPAVVTLRAGMRQRDGVNVCGCTHGPCSGGLRAVVHFHGVTCVIPVYTPEKFAQG